MSYRCVTSSYKNINKLFLGLPATLYGDDCPQDMKTEKQLLTGKHILSDELTVMPFVVVDDNKKAVSRCLVTYYKDDDVAYLGFFESINDIAAVKKMFSYVSRKVQRDGKTSIIGPIDASIYINYRFKIDNFDSTYTGEPYNKDYYADLWRSCGFTSKETYCSNAMKVVEDENFDERLDALWIKYKNKGYELKHPNADNFDESLEQVYGLLMQTYSKFHGYKMLCRYDFEHLFGPLENVLNYDMIHLIYYKERLKAFSIAIPNYGNLLRGKMNLKKFIEINKIKKAPKEYVILYVGADPACPGLGGALLHLVRNSMYDLKCTSIGALIREGNVPDKVYKDLQTKKYRYELFELKFIDDESPILKEEKIVGRYAKV